MIRNQYSLNITFNHTRYYVSSTCTMKLRFHVYLGTLEIHEPLCILKKTISICCLIFRPRNGVHWHTCTLKLTPRWPQGFHKILMNKCTVHNHKVHFRHRLRTQKWSKTSQPSPIIITGQMENSFSCDLQDPSHKQIYTIKQSNFIMPKTSYFSQSLVLSKWCAESPV